ncbi:MAG: aminoacyl-tRNA hydrolase [Bacilli bacterium]|nr:aminoacyl-tRNA hydrolase [Bacilli bacterium]
MKLIVGLGNPGKDYENTRHNIGFMVIDNYVGSVNWKEKYNALYTEQIINGEKIVFVKPLTYMNLSGNSVIQFVNFYKIAPGDIIVIQDDLDLPLGKVRIKNNSSSGGHNGIKSIIDRLGTNSFIRIKIGISNTIYDTKDYVLGKFNNEEKSILDNNMVVYKDVINTIISEGVVEAQSRFN